MLILACKACEQAVFSDSAPWPVGVGSMLNVMQIPCPCCGAPSMWDGIANDEGGCTEREMQMRAEERGWKWNASDSSAGGLYRLDRAFVPFCSRIRCNTRGLIEFAGHSTKHRDWWVSALMKYTLEQQQPQAFREPMI